MDRSGVTPSLPFLRPALVKSLVRYGKWMPGGVAVACGGLLVCLFLAAPVSADVAGKVTAVIDGDTVQILDIVNVTHEISLRCADAPELEQDSGAASAAYLAGLISSKDVAVESGSAEPDGQVLGTITLRGADINFRMIRAGFAWHDNGDRCGSAWDTAQRRAQQSGRGLWANPAPVPPWDYRQSQE